MSFILEALKKSEQQRQEKNASEQKVRKRTLSLTSSQPGRNYYWLLAALLPLVLLCGWWLYSETNSTRKRLAEQSLATSAPLVSQSKEAESPVILPATLASATQQPVAAEPAPVPSIYISPPVVPAKTKSVKDYELAAESRRLDAVAATEIITIDKPVATVVIEQSQPQASDGLPLYTDLSRELRDRMPALVMSMHFYNREPNRRLVRINDRLLHEGDLVSQNLELVEITPTGVILDFLGKAFKLPGSHR